MEQSLVDLLPPHLQEYICSSLEDGPDIASCRATSSELRALLWGRLQSLQLQQACDVSRAVSSLPLPRLTRVQQLTATLWGCGDLLALQQLLDTASEHWPLLSCATLSTAFACLPQQLCTLKWPPSVVALDLTLPDTAASTSSSSSSSTSGGGGASNSTSSSTSSSSSDDDDNEEEGPSPASGTSGNAEGCGVDGLPPSLAALPRMVDIGWAPGLVSLDVTLGPARAAGAESALGGGAGSGGASTGSSSSSSASTSSSSYDLSPLTRLGQLKALRLRMEGSHISSSTNGAFLPPGLTHLSIATKGCGSAWSPALDQGACPSLLSLHLDGLGVSDLTPGDPNLDFLSGLTSLTALTGHLVDFPLLCFCIPSQLTQLEVLTLASPVVEACSIMEPATYLSPNQLEACAGSITSLHTWWEPEDGIPGVPLASLTDLTLKVTSFFQEFAPMFLVMEKLPALRRLALQPSYASFGLHLLLPLTQLEAVTLCMFTCSSLEGFAVASLVDHPSLAYLTFQGLTLDTFAAEQEAFTSLVTHTPKLVTLTFQDSYFSADKAAAQLEALREAAEAAAAGAAVAGRAWVERQVVMEGSLQTPGSAAVPLAGGASAAAAVSEGAAGGGEDEGAGSGDELGYIWSLFD